jgi:hypothetical protein
MPANRSNIEPGQGLFMRLNASAGKSRAAAVRALAFKWIPILWKCWQARTRYDEVDYLQALKRTSSPLVPAIEAAADAVPSAA